MAGIQDLMCTQSQVARPLGVLSPPHTSQIASRGMSRCPTSRQSPVPGKLPAGARKLPGVLRPVAATKQAAPVRQAPDDNVQIWKELRERAEAAFQQASTLVPQVEEAEQHAVEARAEADVAERLTAEAEAHAASKRPEAEAAIHDLRAALTGLKASLSMEVKVDDLHSLADRRLQDWLQEHPAAENFQVISDMAVTIGGLGPCHAVARLAATLVDGKRYAIVCLAAGEQSPEGRLDGTLLHWGCAWHPGSGWEPPPPGWHTDPNVSYAAGKAWQTPLGRYQPRIDGRPEPGMAAYATVLQLPVEGVLRGGGLEVVLKRPTAPEWVVTEQGRNIYVSFKEAHEFLEAWDAAEVRPVDDPRTNAAAEPDTKPATKQLSRAASLEEAQERRKAAQQERQRAKEAGADPSAAASDAKEAEVEDDPAEATARKRDALKQQIKLARWESAAEAWEPCDTPLAALPDDASASLAARLDTAAKFLDGLAAMQASKGTKLESLAAFEGVQAALERADVAVEEAEHAQHEAQVAREEANRLKMVATEAESTARQMRGDAVGAVQEARQATVRLKGKDEEVSLDDLHALAALRLASWLGWVDSRNTLDEEQTPIQNVVVAGDEEVAPPEPAQYSYPIEGLAGSLVAHVALCQEGGRPCAAVSVAAGERFPDGLLNGAMLHWACSQRESGAWQTPPEGWTADQDGSSGTGDSGAIHTPLETTVLPDGQNPSASSPPVQTLTLQIPLEGVARTGGLTFVLRTAAGKWHSSVRHSTRCDFFVSFRELGTWLAQREAAALKRQLEAEAAAKQAEQAAREAAEAREAAAKLAQQQAEASAQQAQQEAEAKAQQAQQEAEAKAKQAQQEAEAAAQRAEQGKRAAANAASQQKPQAQDTVESTPTSHQDVQVAQKHEDAAQGEPIAGASGKPPSGEDTEVAWGMVDQIAEREHKAERSLMHRYSIAAELLESAVGGADLASGLLSLAVWLRFSAARHLTWNRNYNVKPREISAAQDRLTQRLAELYEQRPDLRQHILLAMAAVGRGGQGNIGQRIRDEILDVQQRTGAKGGMMEEWHQKLHNNTSPDDVVICEALLAYLAADLDISQYWATLQAANISKERLASFDRAIRSEPSFKKEQMAGLTRGLTAYLQTLKAVHSGADLNSAANTVLGYMQPDMKGKPVSVDPVPNVATDKLRALLQTAMAPQQAQAAVMDGQSSNGADVHQSAGSKEPATGGQPAEEDLDADELLLRQLEALAAARAELRPFLAAGNAACGGRLRDVIFLDIALEGALRTAVEGSLSQLKAWAAEGGARLPALLRVVTWSLEAASLAFAGDAELALCLTHFKASQKAPEAEVALRASAAAERTRRALGDLSAVLTCTMQPTAEALGSKLRIEPAAVGLFSEEVIRGTPAAPLSQLLGVLEPLLRTLAGLGAWQLISAGQGPVVGRLVVADSLAEVQHQTYQEATVLYVEHVGGEEEVPEGAVAVVTPDSPDVLCHAGVRARNSSVLFASCFDGDTLAALRALEGQHVRMEVSQDGTDVSFRQAEATAPSQSNGQTEEAAKATRTLQLARKEWCGAFALPSARFTADVVGGKSLNTAKLQGKLSDWVQLPPSVAIPFGAFDAALEDSANAGVAAELRQLAAAGDLSSDRLAACRGAVGKLHAPAALKQALAQACQTEGIPWQEHEWPAMWGATTRVWASKWNERAVVSLRKAGLSHDALQMAVLCQTVVPAAYAFVAHTTNPLTDNANEIYVELVMGLGESLVGNYPGGALRFTADKARLQHAGGPLTSNPTELSENVISILGFPSKSHALVLPDQGHAGKAKPVLIFRSDSNGEDLEGYAGAGLFDSVQSTAPVSVRVDYSADRLMTDAGFRRGVLSKIAIASAVVEAALGGQQDIEGVICSDGSLFVVQSRPQV